MPLLSTRFGMRGLPAIEHAQVVLRDSADDWVALLSGPEARAARGTRLPLDMTRPFDLHANAPRMDRFLARVLVVPPPRRKALGAEVAGAGRHEVAE